YHPSRPATALSHLGLPADASGLPVRNGFHDVLFIDRKAATVGAGYVDHDFRPVHLCFVPQADRPWCRDRIVRAVNRMRYAIKLAVIAATLWVVALDLARAGTATAD